MSNNRELSKVDIFLNCVGDCNLSDHFKMKEFLVTNRYDLQEFSPLVTLVTNMCYGAYHILETLRHLFNRPIIITSGYRSSLLNEVVGGVANSQHLNGCAVDIPFGSKIDGISVDPMENEIIMMRTAFLAGQLPFDQLIIYRNRRFFHISWSPNSTPRGQIIYK